MTIEIADRLVKLRKKYGYSQEELADKLGLSRQAVSKWERAEASPDTDNLICLAKLYGVSLDELLATDEDVDTIVKEQIKEDAKDDFSANDGERVVINNKGIRVRDNEGGTVVIDDEGIVCTDKDGKVVKKRRHGEHDKAMAIIGCIEGFLFTVALIGFFLLGFLLDLWTSSWLVFLVPEIICSIARAIRKKNAAQFNMPFLTTFAYFFFCLMLPSLVPGFPAYWHILWVVFLLIPVYYTAVGTIHKIIGKKPEDDDDDDDEDEDKD